MGEVVQLTERWLITVWTSH